jgi:hypothetical protein
MNPMLPLILSVSFAAAPAATPAERAPRAATPARLDDALLHGEARRVRAMDGRVQNLLSAGVRRSPAFAGLLTALQETDVIVYVEATMNMPSDVTGRLLLQAVTPSERYLRIQYRATLPGDRAIEVVAHELRHALEIAEERSVTDSTGLGALYQRIGHRSTLAHAPARKGYETLAALQTGDIVRTELSGRRARSAVRAG